MECIGPHRHTRASQQSIKADDGSIAQLDFGGSDVGLTSADTGSPLHPSPLRPSDRPVRPSETPSLTEG